MKTNTSTKPDSLPHSLLNTIFVFAAATTLWTTCPTARGQDIFVANVASGTIGEYTTSGATVNASLVSGLGNPFGIAVSGSDLFVTSVHSGIGEYTTSGATVNASLVSGLDYPYGIAVSGSDLFVVNQGSGTIGEYTTTGVTVNASLVSGLDNPSGIAISEPVSSVPDAGSTLGLMFLSLAGLAALRRRFAK